VNRLPNLTVQQHQIPFELYDSFATRQFGGNVAGVVVSKTPIASSLMQDVASELGAPTTGFAYAGPGQPVSIRFFTPRQEIGACGHATVAVATALVKRRIWPKRDGQVQATTPVGSLPVSLGAAANASHSSATLVGLTYRPCPLGPENVPPREAIEAGLAVSTDPGLPIGVVWTGLRHLIVPVGSLQALAGIALSEAAVTALAAPCGADTICVFTMLGENRVRMRDLCAPIGMLEEPASGTTSAALASYLTRHRDTPKPAVVSIEQGVEMGRPSRIEVHAEPGRGQAVATVWGSALRTAGGTIFLTGRERKLSIDPQRVENNLVVAKGS
jgi:trans-2,3-dihydro-3-hydroxyanthranilate isomerase